MSNKLTRRIIFIIFVCLFFIISAVTLPYAFGYKLNLSGMKLQRTGMFYIKTTPSGAAIFLNDKQQTNFLSRFTGQATPATTPIKLKNITPGTYQVRLELAGYWPWTKQLVINPSETTYLQDVYFFKKSSPKLIAELKQNDIKNVLASPDKKNIAVLTTTDLKIFSWDKLSRPAIFPLAKNTGSRLLWSEGGQKVVAGNLVIDWRNNTISDLAGFGVKTGDKLVWLNDNTLYWLSGRALQKIDLKNNQAQATALAKQSIADFIVRDGYLYLISSGAEPSLAAIKLTDNSADAALTIALQPATQYKFIDLGQNNINIQATASGRLYAIGSRLPWFKDYTINDIGPVTAGQWVGGDSKLIFSNNFELSLWDKNDSAAKLLTRISHKITALDWHKSNNYIIFATNQTINTLELDDRYNYNISTLQTLDTIAYPVFNRDGNSLLFWTSINGTGGLYSLDI